MNKHGSIETVVLKGLCTSCGACVAICPQNAVKMEETPGGLLFARVCIDSCVSCGLCLRICGGSHLESELLPANIDPFKGEVLAAYCGYASDSEMRLRGQSGGVVTALLQFLMDSGQVTKALVTKMPGNDKLRPSAFLAVGKEGLLESQGSQYCPVAVNAALPGEIGKTEGKLAVVGLPCHIHSIRNAQRIQENWKHGIDIAIGLFCDRTLAYSAIDYLLSREKVTQTEVETFRYRDKLQGGWPGKVYIRTKEKREIRSPMRERIRIKEFFTPLRCRLCFDKMNIFSDIAVGDAWGVREEGDGFSVLIANSEKGLRLLKKAASEGVLCVEEVPVDAVFAGQGVEVRRTQYSAFSKIWEEMGHNVPLPPIADNWLSICNGKSLKGYRKKIKLSLSLLKNHSRKAIVRSVRFRIHISKAKSFIIKVRGKIISKAGIIRATLQS